MVEHEHAQPDVAGYVLGVLEPDEAAEFGAHLDGCRACRDEVAELAGAGELLALAAAPVEVPADLEERTFAAIAAADAAPRRRRWDGPRRLVAAAAAVVLIGVGITVVRQATEPEAAVAQVIELEAPGGGPASAVAHVRRTPTGGVIDMEVEGLAPPPPGAVFECWLVAASGDSIERPNRVSVGTFSVDADGRAKVRWDFSADTARFPRMGVTIEPDDGNPVHTTQRVLAAKTLL